MSRANTFSLSRPDPLPTAYKGFALNTGHRTILRIIRMLRDPEIDEKDRPGILSGMFFASGKRPGRSGTLMAFDWFVTCGKTDRDETTEGVRDMDYEQDAQEIYAAFRQLYGIDLMETELHWWQFSALLSGCFACDNALSAKVRLRHADDSDGQRKAAADRAKRAVAIKEQHSKTDVELHDQLQNALKCGGDISGIIEQMKQG